MWLGEESIIRVSWLAGTFSSSNSGKNLMVIVITGKYTDSTVEIVAAVGVEKVYRTVRIVS